MMPGIKMAAKLELGVHVTYQFSPQVLALPLHCVDFRFRLFPLPKSGSQFAGYGDADDGEDQAPTHPAPEGVERIQHVHTNKAEHSVNALPQGPTFPGLVSDVVPNGSRHMHVVHHFQSVRGHVSQKRFNHSVSVHCSNSRNKGSSKNISPQTTG